MNKITNEELLLLKLSTDYYREPFEYKEGIDPLNKILTNSSIFLGYVRHLDDFKFSGELIANGSKFFKIYATVNYGTYGLAFIGIVGVDLKCYFIKKDFDTFDESFKYFNKLEETGVTKYFLNSNFQYFI